MYFIDSVVFNHVHLLLFAEEFVANSCLLDSSAVRPVQVELSSVRTAAGPGQAEAAAPAPAVAPALTPTPAPTSAAAPTSGASTPALFPPTKLVIKQGGGGASVSWSTSSMHTPAPVVRSICRASHAKRLLQPHSVHPPCWWWRWCCASPADQQTAYEDLRGTSANRFEAEDQTGGGI